MVQYSTIEKLTKRDPSFFKEITDYDYDLLMALKIYTKRNKRLQDAVLFLEYQVQSKKQINLELELRKVVLAYYQARL